MPILIYILIFIFKVVENSIATLRLIVVSNGKKWLGAVLNFIIAVIWIISTGLVITNIKSDPLKILFFALGSFFGSYIGSYIEEKIALGSNMLLAIINPYYTNIITEQLKDPCYLLKSEQQDILLIIVTRKKRKDVVNIIRKFDQQAILISQVARQLIFK
ncbi:MAG: DUF5698 domain-containing protein [Bacilli bacterium]